MGTALRPFIKVGSTRSHMTEQLSVENAIEAFIAAANDFDLEKATALFSISAVIDDPSTGKTFRNESGIRRYIADYFVSYRTISKIIEIEGITPDRAVARVNFTGSFGHEIGTLDVILSRGGLINRYQPLTNYTYQKINF